MQKARIITNSADKATNFAEQLRRRGFQVEIVPPDSSPSTDADLEVRLEACPKNAVLGRAAELATRDGADVFIAPGALGSPNGSVVPMTKEAPSLADILTGMSARLQSKRNLMAKALREQRATMRQARLAQAPEESLLRLAPQPMAALATTDASSLGMQPARQTQRPSPRFAGSIRRSSRTSRDMRLVFALSALCALVMMFGWFGLTRAQVSPMSNLANSAPDPIQQAAPFTDPQQNPSTTVPQSAEAALASPVPESLSSTSVATPQLEEAREPATRKPPQSRSRKRAYGRDNDLIAEDVVRRLDTRPPEPSPAAVKRIEPVPQHAPASQNASLKRISDE